MPWLTEILNLPLPKNVLGVYLSGAGPTIMALWIGELDILFEESLKGCFKRHGIDIDAIRLSLAQTGFQCFTLQNQ